MSRPIRLIVDDYGLAPGVCEAILDLIARGRLTGTGCMTGFADWPDMAERLRPFLDQAAIGLHLTLTDQTAAAGRSSLAPDRGDLCQQQDADDRGGGRRGGEPVGFVSRKPRLASFRGNRTKFVRPKRSEVRLAEVLWLRHDAKALPKLHFWHFVTSARRLALSKSWSLYLDSLHQLPCPADVGATGPTEAPCRPTAAISQNWWRPTCVEQGQLEGLR